MEYFMLKQDEMYKNIVQLPIKSNNPIQRKIEIGIERADELKGVFNFIVKSKPDNFYPDVMDTPLFLVSDAVKKVLCAYDHLIICKCVVLSDAVLNIQHVYWMILMDQLDCLHDTAQLYPNRSLKQLVLDQKKIGDRKIFRVAGIEEKVIIINLDIAESLLRRLFQGMVISRVNSR